MFVGVVINLTNLFPNNIAGSRKRKMRDMEPSTEQGHAAATSPAVATDSESGDHDLINPPVTAELSTEIDLVR